MIKYEMKYIKVSTKPESKTKICVWEQNTQVLLCAALGTLDNSNHSVFSCIRALHLHTNQLPHLASASYTVPRTEPPAPPAKDGISKLGLTLHECFGTSLCYPYISRYHQLKRSKTIPKSF